MPSLLVNRHQLAAAAQAGSLGPNGLREVAGGIQLRLAAEFATSIAGEFLLVY